MHPFKHTTPLQLRFSDIDRLGHLNNSVYFAFFDLGKTSYFDAICEGRDRWRAIDIVVASVKVDFKVPVFAHERIEVLTKVVEIGNKSFRLEQQLIDADSGVVKCEAHTVMAGFDPTLNCAKEISAYWVEALCEFEGYDLRRKE